MSNGQPDMTIVNIARDHINGTVVRTVTSPGSPLERKVSVERLKESDDLGKA